MAINNSKNNDLVFNGVDLLFIYSFEFDQVIDSKAIIDEMGNNVISINEFNTQEENEDFNKFIKYIVHLDKNHNNNDQPVNRYSRMVLRKDSDLYSGYHELNEKLGTYPIVFSTLYDIGIGNVTVWIPLPYEKEINIPELIDYVKLGLPTPPYSTIKKIPLSFYENFPENRGKNRIDFLGYEFIQEILKKGKKDKGELYYDKIDCYPFITIRSFNKDIEIDEFKKECANELWGILSGELLYDHIRTDTIKSYLKNIALYDDRLAMPSEDGTIFVFGKEVNEVYERTKNMEALSAELKDIIDDLQDFMEYRMIAYYLYTELYRFEVFYLKVLSWKLSQFLDKKLLKSSMDEIIRYYYLFSKSLEHYYNFGENLLLYLPTWNRQVWNVLREREVSDSYTHLLEGLKIIETTVQLSNNMKSQAYSLMISISILVTALLSFSISSLNWPYYIKMIIVGGFIALFLVIYIKIIPYYYKNKLKSFLKKTAESQFITKIK